MSKKVDEVALQDALYGMRMSRLHGDDAERLIREVVGEDNGAPLPEGVPLLADAAQAVVREWEKDHTVESMDELITALCFHPAIAGALREALEAITCIERPHLFSSALCAAQSIARDALSLPAPQEDGA